MTDASTMRPGDSDPEWDSPGGVETVRVAATAYFAVQAPETASVTSPCTVVALHGWGQNCRSFLRRLGPFADAGITVVAPQAPHQTYLDLETRKVGFSWLTNYDRHRAVPDLVGLLDTVLAEVSRSHGPLGSIFLLGFSQGVSVAYRYACQGTHSCAGVIACGGDLPPDVARSLPEQRPFPVLLVHGAEDAIVPVSKADAALEVFQALSWPVEHIRFDGGHEIAPAIAGEIARWIRILTGKTG